MGYYRTGDVASRDEDGYFTFIGRADDVFKASDYRISPFELESVLIEHPAVVEAAIVPSPDPVRLAVPKAFVVLAPGYEPCREVAADIFTYCRAALCAVQAHSADRVLGVAEDDFGKIRRVELRAAEQERRASGQRGVHEFFEEDLA